MLNKLITTELWQKQNLQCKQINGLNSDLQNTYKVSQTSCVMKIQQERYEEATTGPNIAHSHKQVNELYKFSTKYRNRMRTDCGKPMIVEACFWLEKPLSPSPSSYIRPNDGNLYCNFIELVARGSPRLVGMCSDGLRPALPLNTIIDKIQELSKEVGCD